MDRTIMPSVSLQSAQAPMHTTNVSGQYIDPKNILYKIFFEAAQKGDLAVVRRLAMEIDINIRNSSQATALIVAANCGHLPIVDFLIQRGASVNSCDVIGWTALHHSSRHNRHAVTQLLLISGANIHACDRSGCSALVAAAEAGACETVAVLLRAGADAHMKTSLGDTALILAAGRGQLTVVKLLLAAGVGLDARGGNGTTALLHAIRNKRWALVEYLISKGARVDRTDDSGADATAYAKYAKYAKHLRKTKNMLLIRDDTSHHSNSQNDPTLEEGMDGFAYTSERDSFSDSPQDDSTQDEEEERDVVNDMQRPSRNNYSLSHRDIETTRRFPANSRAFVESKDIYTSGAYYGLEQSNTSPPILDSAKKHTETSFDDRQSYEDRINNGLMWAAIQRGIDRRVLISETCSVEAASDAVKKTVSSMTYQAQAEIDNLKRKVKKREKILEKKILRSEAMWHEKELMLMTRLEWAQKQLELAGISLDFEEMDQNLGNMSDKKIPKNENIGKDTTSDLHEAETEGIRMLHKTYQERNGIEESSKRNDRTIERHLGSLELTSPDIHTQLHHIDSSVARYSYVHIHDRYTEQSPSESSSAFIVDPKNSSNNYLR